MEDHSVLLPEHLRGTKATDGRISTHGGFGNPSSSWLFLLLAAGADVTAGPVANIQTRIIEVVWEKSSGIANVWELLLSFQLNNDKSNVQSLESLILTFPDVFLIQICSKTHGIIKIPS